MWLFKRLPKNAKKEDYEEVVTCNECNNLILLSCARKNKNITYFSGFYIEDTKYYCYRHTPKFDVVLNQNSISPDIPPFRFFRTISTNGLTCEVTDDGRPFVHPDTIHREVNNESSNTQNTTVSKFTSDPES